MPLGARQPLGALMPPRKELGRIIYIGVIIALGVATAFSLISVANAIVARPPWLRNWDRLVSLRERVNGQSTGCSIADIRRLIRPNRLVSDVSVYHVFPNAAYFLSGPQPGPIHVAFVSSRFFAAFGIHPRVGTGFDSLSDSVAGAEQVVLSWSLYSRIGGSETTRVRSVQINRRRYAIVGVMPPGFRYPSSVDAWMPIDLNLSEPRQNRYWSAVGLLRPGARGESLGRLGHAASGLTLDRSEAGVRVTFRPFLATYLQTRSRIATLLELLAGALLLIAVFSSALLLVGAQLGSTKEAAIRLALGAGRLDRLARVAVSAALTAILASGVAALLSAMAISLAAAEIVRGGWPIPLPASSLGALATAALWAALSTALAYTTPGVIAAASHPGGGLTPILSNPGLLAPSRRAKRGLVAVLAVNVFGAGVLATTGAISVEALWRIRAGAFGVRTSGCFIASFLDPGAMGRDYHRTAVLIQGALAAVRALPGVRAAAFSSAIPMSESTTTEVGTPVRGARQLLAFEPVTSGYFRALGLKILAGRTFNSEESSGTNASGVCIMSRAAAAHLFGDWAKAVGRTVVVYGRRCPVIGIASDVKFLGHRERDLYVPFAATLSSGDWLQATLVVRTASNAPSAASIQRAVRSAMPEALLAQPRPLLDKYASIRAEPLAAGRASLAVLPIIWTLLALAIYAAMAAAISLSWRECAIRWAVGGSPGRVVLHIAWPFLAASLLAYTAGQALAVRVLGSELAGVAWSSSMTALSTGFFAAALFPAIARPYARLSRAMGGPLRDVL